MDWKGNTGVRKWDDEKRREREREGPRRTLFACVERESGESRDREHRADKLSEDYSAGWGHVVMNGRS